MARKKAKALPPKMITVYAEILQETELAILVRCDEDADGEWLPKSQIKYSGERGDTGVEIEIPELMADEKGFIDGIGRPEVEVAPAPAEPEQPETVTLHGVITESQEEPEGFIRFRSDGSEYEIAIPKAHVLDHGAGEEPEVDFIVLATAYAVENGLAVVVKGLPDSEAESAPEYSAGKRAFGDNVKWLKEEKITVSQPLSEREKARYAEEMSALDKEIEALKDERAEVSSRLKKQIDAKEEERLAMSRNVDEGELRTFTCDCLKDYASGEMVWTEAYPPYSEVQRRKMTKEEMQPSLLEYSEKMAASTPAEEGAEPSEPADAAPDGEGVDFDAMADAPTDAEDAESDAPAEDAAAEPEGDAPGCASCAHQDSGDDDSCDGCGDELAHYTPLVPATEQAQSASAGAVQ